MTLQAQAAPSGMANHGIRDGRISVWPYLCLTRLNKKPFCIVLTEGDLDKSKGSPEN